MAAISAVTATSGTMDVFPSDPTTTVGRIRLLIPDLEQVDYTGEGNSEYMFSDSHLLNLYAISHGSEISRIHRAAASAVRALATSEGLIQKVIRTEDLQTDGAKLASALLGAAKALDDRATQIDEDDDGYMLIVDYQTRPQINFPYSLSGFPTSLTTGGAQGGFGSWL